MRIRIWLILGLSVQYVLLFQAAHDFTSWPSGLDTDDQGQFPGGHLSHFFPFSPCNAKLLHTSNMELYK